MEAFDRLPLSVQRALDNSICDLNVHTVLARFNQRGEGYTLSLIARSEAEARRNWHTQRGRVLDQSRRSFDMPSWPP